MKKISLALILTFLSLLPQGVRAQYLTPEEVLWEFETLYPPNSRDAAERAKQQAEQSASRREREQEEFFAAQRVQEETDTEDLSETVAALEEAIEALLEEEKNPEDRRIDRLLQRVETHKQVLRIPQDPLNSGAPLIGTGLTTTVAILSLLGAGMWTMRKAKKLEE